MDDENPGLAKGAREGLESLRIVVLAVLAMDKGCLGPAAISRRAGIWRSPDSMHDGITYGVLTSLEADGHVERCRQPNNRPGWKIVPSED